MTSLQRHRAPRIPAKAFTAALASLIAAVFFLTPVPASAAPSVHEAVLEYIETHMPWPQGTVRVDFASGEPTLSAHSKEATFRIGAAGNTDFIGNAAFIVRIYAGGTLVRTETVRTRIEVLRDLLVTARMIRNGAILTEQDLRLVKKWVGRNMPDTLSCLEEAVGKRIIAQVRPGAELTARMLRDAPLVRKGQAVMVLYENGSMRITTVGVPEEDGAAGGLVRVRNVASNKVFYARVLGDSLVGVNI
jgi:flagella basal body P-ring formation protein FlgA